MNRLVFILMAIFCLNNCSVNTGTVFTDSDGKKYILDIYKWIPNKWERYEVKHGLF